MDFVHGHNGSQTKLAGLHIFHTKSLLTYLLVTFLQQNVIYLTSSQNIKMSSKCKVLINYV